MKISKTLSVISAMAIALSAGAVHASVDQSLEQKIKSAAGVYVQGSVQQPGCTVFLKVDDETKSVSLTVINHLAGSNPMNGEVKSEMLISSFVQSPSDSSKILGTQDTVINGITYLTQNQELTMNENGNLTSVGVKIDKPLHDQVGSCSDLKRVE